MIDGSCPPVLLVAFNRPALTIRSFEAIRRVAPSRFFVAVDGPRPGTGDEGLVEQVLEIVRGVDWPCEPHYLIRESNLGCQQSVDSAIDWFLDEAGDGIILEDDCVPDATFFEFCAELLEHYRSDERVGMISGTNVLGRWSPVGDSYHLGRAAVWGWATWKRAWGESNDHLSTFSSTTARARAKQFMGRRRWQNERVQLELIRRGRLDTWDHPWLFYLAQHQQLAVIPAVNLVSNIGFDPTATHTRSPTRFASLSTAPIPFPLVHPARIELDDVFERRWLELESRGPLRQFKAWVTATPFGRLLRWLQDRLIGHDGGLHRV